MDFITKLRNLHPALLAPTILLGLLAQPGEAQSIAASLSNYQSALKVTTVAGVTARSFSGVAFHPETRTLFVIDNDNAVIYELSTAGALLRSISTSGITDPEGIAWQGDDYFLISEEGLANIVRLKLPRTGSGPVAKSDGTALNIGPNMANSGIEGVSYRPASRTAYAVKEIDPPRLYRIALDAAGNPTGSFPNEPFSLEGKGGDAADFLALNDGNFLIVNQEQNRLEGYGPQGQVLSTLPLGMSKPEGIALDTTDGTLYIVGEPLELTVFKRKNTRISRPNPAAPGAPASLGFACSLHPGRTPGGPPLLRYSLPYRTPVRVEYLLLDGSKSDLLLQPMDPGQHESVLERFPGSASPGFYRFTAGSFHRIFTFIQP